MSSSEDDMILPINYETSEWQVRRAARQLYRIKQKGLCWHCGFSLSKDTCKKKLYIKMSVFPKDFFILTIALGPMVILLDLGFGTHLFRDFGLVGIAGFAFCIGFYGVVYSRYIDNKGG